jgi:C_GCAxxG_C_C family probable redox protein
METRVEETIARHDKGYNCAQAVACTYCDLVGLDEATMFKVTEAMGLGMGGMEGTCGAVTGACVVAGMKNSSGNLEHPDSKGATYQLSKEILKAFKEKNQSTICKELKGVQTGTVLRSCPDCIRDAAAIVENILFSEV